MSKILKIGGLLFSVCLLSSRPSFALFLSTDNPYVVYETTQNKYWLNNPGLATGMTPNEVFQFTSSMNTDSAFQGTQWTNWHLATLSELSFGIMGYLGWNATVEQGQIRDLFVPTSRNGDSSAFYMGIFDYPVQRSNYGQTGIGYALYAFILDYVTPGGYEPAGWGCHLFTQGEVYSPGVTSTSPIIGAGAWIVADANPNPVPEPSSLLLLGTGLLGLAGASRGRAKK